MELPEGAAIAARADDAGAVTVTSASPTREPEVNEFNAFFTVPSRFKDVKTSSNSL